MVRPFYIPLVAPHSDLCLSHALPSDIPQKVNVLNDPSVYMSLIGPPYPSSVESVDWWESYEQDRWDKGEVLEAPCGRFTSHFLPSSLFRHPRLTMAPRNARMQSSAR